MFSYELPNLILKHVFQKTKPLFPFIPLFSILFSIYSSELSPWYLCIKRNHLLSLNLGCIHIYVAQIMNGVVTPTYRDFCSNHGLLRVYKLTSFWMKLKQLDTGAAL